MHSTEELNPTMTDWYLLVEAAKRSLREQGYQMERVPGRGMSNVWTISKNGKTQTVSIRTTRDRWFAFAPLDDGRRWKTLEQADLVVVAAMDKRDNPEKIEVYNFPADEVKKRFNAAYKARIEGGAKIKQNFGMWVSLEKSDGMYGVSSGIIDQFPATAVYPLSDMADNVETDVQDDAPGVSFTSISEVMAWARGQVAEIAGVDESSVKLDLKIEY